jgi:hypothetical protein
VKNLIFPGGSTRQHAKRGDLNQNHERRYVTIQPIYSDQAVIHLKPNIDALSHIGDNRMLLSPMCDNYRALVIGGFSFKNASLQHGGEENKNAVISIHMTAFFLVKLYYSITSLCTER